MMARVCKMLLVQLFEVAGTLIFEHLTWRTGEPVMRRLRRRVYAAALQNDIAFFNDTSRFAVEQAVTSDVRILRSLFCTKISRDLGLCASSPSPRAAHFIYFVLSAARKSIARF